MYGGFGTIYLAENPRTGTKAAIKRASAAARKDMRSLVNRGIKQLERVYSQAADDIREEILARENIDGNISIDSLQDLLNQVNQRIAELANQRNGVILDSMEQAAQIGVSPFINVPEVAGSLSRVSHEAVQFVQSFVAEDGLQLADRLWRLDRHAREIVGESIESAIIQGHSAAQAADDFLSRGQRIPPELLDKIGNAKADKLARVAGSRLMTGEGNPYSNALRVFTTEINRAHGEAYRASAFEHPDVIGMRFLLSPRHPRPDICDMHASVNRYGLGKGVYPKGKSPWPAHPNTLSFEEVVFDDEVTDEDRAGKESELDWLKKQPASVQESVLASRYKRAALERDILKRSEITTPWKVLKKRYERKGIDTSSFIGGKESAEELKKKVKKRKK